MLGTVYQNPQIIDYVWRYREFHQDTQNPLSEQDTVVIFRRTVAPFWWFYFLFGFNFGFNWKMHREITFNT
jgi:hypothetical protein